MNYYYLAASLPMLFLENPPLLSLDEFRQICGDHLTESDMEALAELLGPTSGRSKHKFVNDWRDIDIQLKNALARIRASHSRQDASQHLKEHEGFDTYIEKGASDAFSKSNPMDRELELDRLRWSKIEEIEGADSFSSNAILAFALKLRLAERWAAMGEEEGRETADKMVNREPEEGGI